MTEAFQIPPHAYQALPRVLSSPYQCGHYATDETGRVKWVCQGVYDHPLHPPDMTELVKRGLAFVSDFHEDINVHWLKARSQLTADMPADDLAAIPEEMWTYLAASFKMGFAIGTSHTIEKLTGIKISNE